jgi:uncharacterized protein
MLYNVAQLLKETVGSTRTYKIDETVLIDSGTTPIYPQGQLSLMRTDKGVWVSSEVEVREWVLCSRCLKGFSNPLSFIIQEEYLPTVDVTTGQTLRVPERAEGSFTIDPRHVLDLREALRQYVITNRPIKPLCYEECLGLCPGCGADRNQVPCSCRVQAVDPTWTPLLNLLEGKGI